MSFFLGIDGGGTKTECVIGDEKRVLGEGVGSTIKIKKVGEDAAGKALEAAIAEACKSAKITQRQITRTCIGIAGSSIPEVTDWTYGVLKQLVAGEVQVVNDALIAHRAAFGDSPGVLVIAGTGSNVLGINDRSESGRAGGWGPMISDEGSGFWIGRRAVSYAMHAYDGKQKTSLLDAVMKAWDLKTIEDLVSMANSNPPPDFSSLLPAVLQSANSGDKLAGEILTSAANELAQLACVVVRKLWRESSKVTVAITGGVFVHSPQIRERFAELVRTERSGITVNLEPVHPVMGALSMARQRN
ncbi:MAG TPA: BadF/BadG/BcrA/BcrD ATPase family protein [Terriglobales bacterium]|nr:BadF/BadG/BcrA/BcrD ATPase family protein [Terriglobales bacterium]